MKTAVGKEEIPENGSILTISEMVMQLSRGITSSIALMKDLRNHARHQELCPGSSTGNCNCGLEALLKRVDPMLAQCAEDELCLKP